MEVPLDYQKPTSEFEASFCADFLLLRLQYFRTCHSVSFRLERKPLGKIVSRKA